MLAPLQQTFSDTVVIPGRSHFQSEIAGLPERNETRVAESILPEEILVVEKKSLWQLDRERYGFDEASLRSFYEQQGVSADRIYFSHLNQIESARLIRESFPEATIVGRDEYENALLAKPKLVIALGGDNHAHWVSHNVPSESVFIGINSDPVNSHGANLQGDITQLPLLRDQLISGTYRFLPYSRLQVELNGKVLPLAFSEIFIGDRMRMNMSRYFMEVIRPDSEKEVLEQKDSGVLIATGAGSTGWFQSAVRSQFHFSPQFTPTIEGAAYHATESFIDKGFPSASGILEKQDAIEITSRFNRTGIISIDASEETTFEFPRGSVAKISLAPDPLWVVSLSI